MISKNYIKINHGNGVYTLMAHLKYNSATVKVGDKVKQGQTIGIMGNTGYSFGVHCHYEVYIDKKRVNPFNYTYYTDKHVVGTNTLKKYKPKKEEDEDDQPEGLETGGLEPVPDEEESEDEDFEENEK